MNPLEPNDLPQQSAPEPTASTRVPGPTDHDEDVIGATAPWMGFAMVPEPEHIGLARIDDDELFRRLSRLPDSALFWLANLANLVHTTGETEPQTQRTIAELASGPLGQKLQTWLRADHWMVLSYEATIRLIGTLFLTPVGSTSEDPTVEDLLELLIQAQSRLIDMRLDDKTDDDPELQAADVAFTLFRGANSPAQGPPHLRIMQSACFGSLIATACSKRGKKHQARAHDALIALGGVASVQALHTCAVALAMRFTNADAQIAGTSARTAWVRIDTATSPRQRCDRALAMLLTAQRSDVAFHGEVGALFAPRAILPAQVRWRPLLRRPVGDEIQLGCWDPRAFNDLVSTRFPQWIDSVFGDDQAARDAFGGAWDDGTEQALDAFAGCCVPSWRKPPRTGYTNCDRVFELGDELFMVEIKSVRPGEVLSNGSSHDFMSWLHAKFFKKDGFPQVYGTLAALDKMGLRPFARKLRRYRRIWPIVASWTQMCSHAAFTSALAKLDRSARAGAGLESRLLHRLQAPLIIDFESLIGILECLPALAERDTDLGDVLWSYLQLGNRPAQLLRFVQSSAGGQPRHPRVRELIERQLRTIEEIAKSLSEER